MGLRIRDRAFMFINVQNVVCRTPLSPSYYRTNWYRNKAKTDGQALKTKYTPVVEARSRTSVLAGCWLVGYNVAGAAAAVRLFGTVASMIRRNNNLFHLASWPTAATHQIIGLVSDFVRISCIPSRGAGY